jgi:hypothetical protein
MDQQRLERAARALAIERLTLGGLVAIAPGRVLRTLASPHSDTEAARYMARLLGIRQVVLGVILWQSRHDREWLRRMATLNAVTEALDAVVTLVPVLRGRGGRPNAALVGAALTTSAVFLALREAAS